MADPEIKRLLRALLDEFAPCPHCGRQPELRLNYGNFYHENRLYKQPAGYAICFGSRCDVPTGLYPCVATEAPDQARQRIALRDLWNAKYG